MAQHDYVVDNANGATFRADVNSVLAAIVSNNAGATAPSVTYGNMFWADTTANQLKKRNNANTAWVVLGSLDAVNLGALQTSGGALTGMLQTSAGTNIASAASIDLGAVAGNAVTVTHSTGTTAITSLGGTTSVQAGTEITVTFSITGGTLSLTHNATSMALPGGSNITLSNGDVVKFIKTSSAAANWRLVSRNSTSSVQNNKLESVSVTQSAGALTISINPSSMDFRSTTLTSGIPVTRTWGSAATMTITADSSLGTPTGTKARIAVLAQDNAGTVEAAANNIAGGLQLDETNLINTTAEGGAGGADSATVIYSTTARTGVSYRVVAFVEAVWTSGSGWSTPTLVQPVGGQVETPLRFGRTSYSAAHTPAAAESLVRAHGLSTTPTACRLVFECLVADAGYSVGDKFISPGQWNGSTASPLPTYCDGTNIGVKCATGFNVYITNKSTGAAANPTAGSWRYFFDYTY